MTNVQEHRLRAFELLEEKLPKDKTTLIDRQIDEYLRMELGLPIRPLGHEPYVGWMVGEKDVTEGNKRTSQSGIELIKSHEGLRLNAYKCPAGVWTIGYGHTSGVAPGMKIIEANAENLLKEDLLRFEIAVNRLVEVPLNQHQFDALVSFCFNVGIGAFENSTLLILLNKGRYEEAAYQFPRWVHGGGQKLPGLIRRRKEERGLFLS